MWSPFRKKKDPVIFGKYEYREEFVEELDKMIVPDEEVSKGEAELAVITDEEPIISGPVEFVPIEDRWSLKFRSVIRGLLSALVVMMPVFFLTFTAPADILGIHKQLLAYLLTFVSLILWLVIIIRQGGVVIKRSHFEMGILTIFIAWLLAAAFGLQPVQSFLASDGFITLSSFVLFYFLFLNFFERRDIPRMINYFLLGVFVAMLTGLLQFIGLPIFKWLPVISASGGNSQFNTIGTPNSLGVLAVLTIVLAASRYFNSLKITFNDVGQINTDDPEWLKVTWRIVSLGAVITAIPVLLILNWWVFYFLVVLGMAVIILLPGITSKVAGTRIVIKAMNLIGPLLILTFSILMIFSSRYVSFGFITQDKVVTEVNLSQQNSIEVIKKIINQRPVFGFGLQNFKIAFDAFKPAALNKTIFWNTHFEKAGSELLELVADGGLVLLAAFLVLLFYVFRNILRNKNISYYSWLILPGLVVITGAAFFYHFNIVLYFVFWLLISLAALVSDRGDDLKVGIDSTSLVSVGYSLVFVLVLAAGIVAGYLLTQRYRADLYLAKASQFDVSKSDGLDQAITLLTSAVNTSNSDGSYLSSLGQLLSSRLSFEVNKGGNDAKVAAKLENLTKSVIGVANRLTKDFPNNSSSWLNAGKMYQNLTGLVSGSDDAAAAAYSEYVKRTPNDPDGYVKLASIYLNRAERNRLALIEAKDKKLNVRNEKDVANLILDGYNKAEGNLKEAVSLRDDLADAIYNLGVIYERENRLKEAIKQLELSNARDFSNPGLAFELGLLYYRDNQKDKAFNEMLRAVTLFKDYSNARWYLALMLEEQGKIDLAIAQLQEILKLDVNKGNPTVLQKIASLQAGQREIPPARVTSKQPLESKRVQ